MFFPDMVYLVAYIILSGHSGVGDVKTMASLIFDEVASFAHSKPIHLKSICVVVHDRSMVSDFVNAVEDAEKLEGRPVKKFFGKIKGINQSLCTHD